MASPNIGSNTFYNLMLDQNTDQQEKHASLIALFNINATKTKVDELRTEYSHFRGFLMGKHDTIKEKLTKTEDKIFDMAQMVDGGSPDRPKVTAQAAGNVHDLGSMLDNNREIESILTTMFSAEAASHAFGAGSTPETTSLYQEVQEQDLKITNMQAWNSNILRQMDEPSPAPEPVAAAKKSYALGSDVIVLKNDVTAPERATFRKRSRSTSAITN